MAVASDVISRVRALLIDQGVYTNVRYADAELLQWVTDAQRTLVEAMPRVSTTSVQIHYVAGVRQTIDATIYHQILSGVRNVSNGGASLNSLFQVDRDLLDTQYPTWPQATPSVPTVYTYDLSDPTAFYCYPPSDGTGYFEANLVLRANDLVTTGDTLVVEAAYLPALVDYVMWRCCLKMSDYAPGQSAAAQYLQSFSAFIAATDKDPVSTAAQSSKV